MGILKTWKEEHCPSLWQSHALAFLLHYETYAAAHYWTPYDYAKYFALALQKTVYKD